MYILKGKPDKFINKIMKYNLIGIDPSLISTGVVINGKMFNYCRETDATGLSFSCESCLKSSSIESNIL